MTLSDGNLQLLKQLREQLQNLPEDAARDLFIREYASWNSRVTAGSDPYRHIQGAEMLIALAEMRKSLNLSGSQDEETEAAMIRITLANAATPFDDSPALWPSTLSFDVQPQLQIVKLAARTLSLAASQAFRCVL